MGAVLSALQAAGVPAGLKLPHATSSAQDAFSLRRRAHNSTMADEDLNLYDEIEIEDCFYDETLQIYHHPCPCGDRFEISMADMRDGEDIARCPSCSLMIRIIFDQVCIRLYITGGESFSTNMASSVRSPTRHGQCASGCCHRRINPSLLWVSFRRQPRTNKAWHEVGATHFDRRGIIGVT